MASDTFTSSTCRSPANCGGNCKCGTAPNSKIKMIPASTMRGKTRSGLVTTSYRMPKPTMQNMGGTP